MNNKEKKYLTPNFHLTPISGWLNDPNGLCQLDGVHHIFFQYSPDAPKGGEKDWGHYSTKDFINYDFTGVFMRPDLPSDASGVYSGCAMVEDGTMYIYYTGNVKHPGNYDYIFEGRESNTTLVESLDGVSHTSKEILITSQDYPDNLSLHVRDPKVFKVGQKYYMILGARTKSAEGCAIIFTSDDKRNWHFSHSLEKPNFGYMWECPDLFVLDGKQFLSASPQGLEAEEFKYQNIYQSGYFVAAGDLLSSGNCLGQFTEWDYGFDFYAPQTYVDEQGRVILIAWMGMPDNPYGDDPTVEDGWQHMLSIPRQLILDEKTGKISQKPIEEFANLREQELFNGNASQLSNEQNQIAACQGYEVTLNGFDGKDFSLTFNHGFIVKFAASAGILTFEFADEKLGATRDIRRIKLDKTVSSMDIFVDTCSIEFFINDGQYTFTTKYFKEKEQPNDLAISGQIENVNIYEMRQFNITKV